MGLKDITAGDKIAHAIGARFIKSKKGTFGFEVAFEFVEPSTGGPERLSWVGWLSQNAIEKSLETLVEVLGYNGSEVTDPNGVLTDPNVLNFKKEVKLVVEMEEGRDAETGAPNGKLYPRIKWVNNIGGSMYQGVQVESIKNDLGAVGFKAAFLAARQNAGMSAGPRPNGAANPGVPNYAPGTQTAPPPAFSDEEIPF